MCVFEVSPSHHAMVSHPVLILRPSPEDLLAPLLFPDHGLYTTAAFQEDSNKNNE